MSNLHGEIITFYSYKGGVGRSMALANIACLLARKQKDTEKILMIDWDLEAPGLHQFFHGKFTDNINEKADLSTKQLGLIDLFYEIKNQLEKNLSPNNSLENIFKKIEIEKYIVKINYPSLYLMPAGKFDDGFYSSRVNQFDWADFFDKYPLVIKQFAEYLRKKYKFVLIDSRTGYTDISGICTSIMPEKLVAIFTPNRQSLSGVVEMIRRATDYRKQSDDLRPLMIFPLPSRIETGESILQKEWRFGNAEHEGYQIQITTVLKNIYSLEKCDLTNYFDKYKLQYIPRYSYGEELAVLSERYEDRLSLAYSFGNFSEKLIGFDSPWEELKDELFTEEEEIVVDEFSKAKAEERRKLYIRTAMSTLGIVGLIFAYFWVSPYINLYINNFYIAFFVILFGLSKDLRTKVLEKIIEPVSLVAIAGDKIKTGFLEVLLPYASSALIKPNALQKSFLDFIKPINAVFDNVVYALRNHTSLIAERLEPNNDLRVWRFFGYFFQLVFLCLFAYADLIQLVNNIAVLLPEDVSLLGSLYNNLSLSLLISLVGTAIASSFIISDLAGITKFGRWSEIQSPYLKKSIYFLTWSALTSTIIIGTIIAITRITALPDVSPLLSVQTYNSLIIAANLAQTIIIIPLLIMTFLFLSGIVGFAVLYVIVVWFFSFVLQAVQLVFTTMLWLIVFIATYLYQIIVKITLWVLVAVPFLIGWWLFISGEVLVKVFEIFHRLLDIFYFPMDIFINWLISYLGFNRTEKT